MRILVNGAIAASPAAGNTYTPDQPGPSALAIDHGRILAVGSDETILSNFASGAEVEDLRGRTVWPGLTDAHVHFEYFAASLSLINCEVDTLAQVPRLVAARAVQTPPGQWIRGHGWNQNVWAEGFGSIQDLDPVSPNHPVYLTAKSWHAAWVNSVALQMAGITAATPDPEGGQIGRDARGNPTGILLESAMGLVDDLIPAPSVSQVVDLMRPAQRSLWKMGVTGVHDFDGARCFAALQVLDQAGELGLRVVKGIPLDLLPHAAELGLRTGFGSQFLRIGSVKLFADGALGPHTAAMLQPYEDNPASTGILLLDAEQIFEHGQIAVTHGLSMAIHAIGDRANHEVLDGYAHLREFEARARLPRLRHRIEHVQCLHPQDLPRLAELDIIASVQPIHATSDMFMADRFWGARARGAYAFRDLLDRGTRMAFGSDTPVESPNPMLGIHAAVTRRRPDGSPAPEGWYPAQRLALAEALAGYTTGAAYAAQQENYLGRLAPGFAADLIVFPHDIQSLPPQELCRLSPCATMVNGEWVWRED
jgi:predicted amidohydrolase YtcJ